MSDSPRAPAEYASALPAGTRLGEFEILRVLGIGGFGIVYLAFDHALEREVAVKEYMPASMAGRTETMHVSLRSRSDAEVFALGLRSFVNEAKLLARFDHPSLIKVHRFWEANGTAYMAMPVLRGRTLKEVRQHDGAPDEDWLRAKLGPLLDALERLHDQGVYHRDIAPDNIQIEPDGHPVLLDFGAARRVISDKTQTLTAILKPAYAPIEQYAEAGSVKQGPWTDLYALGATIHYLLLGSPPAPATARAIHDEAQTLASRSVPGCSTAFLAAVDWMLEPRPADRPQSVAELRAVLAGQSLTPRQRAAGHMLPQWERTLTLPPQARAELFEGDATQIAPAPPPLGAAPAPATLPPPVPAPPHGSSVVHARAGAAGAAATSGQAASAAQAAQVAQVASTAPVAPAARSRAMPLAVGAIVVVAVAVAAIGFWPRQAGEASPVEPSAGPTATGEPAAPAPTRDATPSGPGAQPGAATPVAATPPATSTTVAAPAPPPVTPAAQHGAGVGPAVTTAAPAPATSGAEASATAPAAAPAARPPSPVAAKTPSVSSVQPPVATTRATAAAAPTPATRPAPELENRPAPARQTARQGTTPATPPAAASPAPPPSAAPQATAAPARVEPSPPTAQVPPPAQPVRPGTPPPTAQPAPATAAPPAPQAGAKPDSPEGRCGARNPLMYFVCMERECLRSEFQRHPDCLAWRRNARPRDSGAGG